jgi:hypothetical protein
MKDDNIQASLPDSADYRFRYLSGKNVQLPLPT